jgi:hypothetical protein
MGAGWKFRGEFRRGRAESVSLECIVVLRNRREAEANRVQEDGRGGRDNGNGSLAGRARGPETQRWRRALIIHPPAINKCGYWIPESILI